jgi:hypothetical protein
MINCGDSHLELKYPHSLFVSDLFRLSLNRICWFVPHRIKKKIHFNFSFLRFY